MNIAAGATCPINANEVARAASMNPDLFSRRCQPWTSAVDGSWADLLSCMWRRQCYLCAPQDPVTSKPYYKRIAEHFEQAGNLEEAERHFIKAGMAHQVSLQEFIRQPKACCTALHGETGPCCCMLDRAAIGPCLLCRPLRCMPSRASGRLLTRLQPATCPSRKSV